MLSDNVLLHNLIHCTSFLVGHKIMVCLTNDCILDLMKYSNYYSTEWYMLPNRTFKNCCHREGAHINQTGDRKSRGGSTGANFWRVSELLHRRGRLRQHEWCKKAWTWQAASRAEETANHSLWPELKGEFNCLGWGLKPG